MLQTHRILIPSIILSLTILSLVVALKGGTLEVQAGESNRFRIEGHGPSMSESAE